MDNFCNAHNIERISLLKIDTEGADLLVLKGAENIIEQKCVDFVQVETCFQTGRRHVLFKEFMTYFDAKGYRFFGLYDQCVEWDGQAAIQYANACFAREGIMLK